MLPLVESYPFFAVAFFLGKLYQEMKGLKSDVKKHDLKLTKIEKAQVSRLMRIERDLMRIEQRPGI